MADNKWYFTLLPKPGKQGLLDVYPIDGMTMDFVVCISDMEGRMRFGRFPDVNYFQRWFRGISADELETRCLYEIAFTERLQKLHFDIDLSWNTEVGQRVDQWSRTDEEMDASAQQTLGALVDSICEVLSELDKPITNVASQITVCTSHGNGSHYTPKRKRSFHVVVSNLYVTCAEQARAFYERCVGRMPLDLSQYVDKAVYNPKQQFRILGCAKPGSGRPKTLQYSWKWIHKDGREEMVTRERIDTMEGRRKDFLETLISVVSGGDLVSIPYFPRFTSSGPSAAPEIIKEAFEMTKDHFGENFCFDYITNKNNVIVLKRKRESFCCLCQRNHEHENPFIVVKEIDTGRFDVIYYCRRSEGGLSMGELVDGERRKEWEHRIIEIHEEHLRQKRASQEQETRGESSQEPASPVARYQREAGTPSAPKTKKKFVSRRSEEDMLTGLFGK